MKKNINLITISLLVTLGLTGCKTTEKIVELSESIKNKVTAKEQSTTAQNVEVQNTSEPQSDSGISDAQLTRNQGTAIGAAIGATTGAVLGGSKEHAMLGAFIGGAIGNLFAEHVANKKADYADSESYMNDVIAEADKMLEISRKEQLRLAEQIERYKGEKAELELLIAKEELQTEKLVILKSDIAANIQNAEKLQGYLVEEIKIQEETLATEEAEINVVLVSQSKSKTAELKTEKAQLEVQLNELNKLFKDIASRDESRN